MLLDEEHLSHDDERSEDEDDVRNEVEAQMAWNEGHVAEDDCADELEKKAQQDDDDRRSLQLATEADPHGRLDWRSRETLGRFV